VVAGTGLGRRLALRVTPAMEAGISDHVWTLDEMCALLPKQIDKKLVLAALVRSV
jgi:hypothetical protein